MRQWVKCILIAYNLCKYYAVLMKALTITDEETMNRLPVLWRKRSQGSNSDKGCRWVERILSLRQACRLHGKSSYFVLARQWNAISKNKHQIWRGPDQRGGEAPLDRLPLSYPTRFSENLINKQRKEKTR